ncbi:DNA/RNA helicase domain-containing protein [Microbulbifer sp. JSM ZJ756]|uniref:DNA/RNA helicase domain-containing protein n=1 Tax=Microbulbifer sp. JSM ZJ756 TaxID=3376191 RepID=UPI0037ADD644
MPAYFSSEIRGFVQAPYKSVTADLHAKYADDGFSTQYTTQTDSWNESIPLLQTALSSVIDRIPEIGAWRVLLELPLYRLRRRIDVVLVSPHCIILVELKVGEFQFKSSDRRQVEEYALDLRDFHEYSSEACILPVLWCTEATSEKIKNLRLSGGVNEVADVGKSGIVNLLLEAARYKVSSSYEIREWESGSYKPVPSVVNAATSLFSGHDVREIAQADASNLNESSQRILEIIRHAKKIGQHALIFLTGVPGSGKTLAGLQVVHQAIETGVEDKGDIVYLSGNTPLVTVLREALARDEANRRKNRGEKQALSEARSSVRTRIQHIIDFLREYLANDDGSAPHEHVIVFDEAQRAWDEDYGRKKFDRPSSEPRLLLDIMARHSDWSAIVALVGGGQEINAGENGLEEWGKALRSLPAEVVNKWSVFGPAAIKSGNEATAHLGIGEISSANSLINEPSLELQVPLRSFRSPLLSQWVSLVLNGESAEARQVAQRLGRYPLYVTRSLNEARSWLKHETRGERRFGLVASSGARRLRAEGLGVTLNATDGSAIAQWYLNDHDDVRSSFALEVTANEYTAQGLELDFVGLCWGGDLIRKEGAWHCRQFRGNSWSKVGTGRRRFISNSYRVLMTRGREGLIIWVPRGSQSDATRDPAPLDETAKFFMECGAKPL